MVCQKWRDDARINARPHRKHSPVEGWRGTDASTLGRGYQLAYPRRRFRRCASVEMYCIGGALLLLPFFSLGFGLVIADHFGSNVPRGPVPVSEEDVE